MSRRRGEFEHRTSIFEGAFRAWSHLGGLEPEDLENKPASDLDPLTNPIEVDARLSSAKKDDGGEDSGVDSKRREYPYEPLPRSGLAHPYVQAILSPWLGADADNEAIQLGLTTLRTWWQHRRKGESGSAVAALGTEKMKGVVEGYTRHFFTLAHCLVMNDKEQPPRSLHNKMKELEKQRNKRLKKRAKEEEDGKLSGISLNGGFNQDQNALAAGINADLTDSTLSPLERLHAAQRRQLAENGGIHTTIGNSGGMNNLPIIDMKGKCVPGQLDLPGVVDAVSHHATQLAHRGNSNTGGAYPNVVASGAPANQYGDPSTIPVVFVNQKGEIQIAMTVDGITCAHCVKIVETVLKGCNGNKSPIDGLLDAAADRALCSVLIKIDKCANAKRIAFEAARNLAMVGYTAKAKEMSIVGVGEKKVTLELPALFRAFEIVATTDSKEIFDWQAPCTCPDNGVMRDDCPRHSQMNSRLFEVFDERQRQVIQYITGGSSKFGMDQNHNHAQQQTRQHFQNHGSLQQVQALHEQQQQQLPLGQPVSSAMFGLGSLGNGDFGNLGGMQGMSGQSGLNMDPLNGGMSSLPNMMSVPGVRNDIINNNMSRFERRASRNPSIISFGGVGGLNGLRGMSVTSEATFGRAMSGLSALSIDWENLDDFDVEVDHSSHINNNSPLKDGDANARSGLRASMNPGGDEGVHVSFKV